MKEESFTSPSKYLQGINCNLIYSESKAGLGVNAGTRIERLVASDSEVEFIRDVDPTSPLRERRQKKEYIERVLV